MQKYESFGENVVVKTDGEVPNLINRSTQFMVSTSFPPNTISLSPNNTLVSGQVVGINKEITKLSIGDQVFFELGGGIKIIQATEKESYLIVPVERIFAKELPDPKSNESEKSRGKNS